MMLSRSGDLAVPFKELQPYGFKGLALFLMERLDLVPPQRPSQLTSWPRHQPLAASAVEMLRLSVQ